MPFSYKCCAVRGIGLRRARVDGQGDRMQEASLTQRELFIGMFLCNQMIVRFTNSSQR